MTGTYVTVAPESHRHLRWRRCQDFAFAREVQFVDIALAESSKLCTTCPILFSKAGNALVPIALLGVEEKHNAFVAPDLRWVGGYTPALLRGYPFRLGPSSQGQIALQVASQEVVEEGGEPFYGPDGGPAPPVAAITKFLMHVAAGRRQARGAAAALDRAGVIKPLVGGGKGNELRVIPGLFTVDDEALKLLPDERFTGLRALGALQFAYHQILSLEMWPSLTKLAQQQSAVRNKISARAAAIYQPEDDGELEIDWSQFKPASS